MDDRSGPGAQEHLSRARRLVVLGTNTAVSGMPPSQAGVAAAVASTSRQVGQTLGVAIVGAVAGGGLAGTLGNGFAGASHPSWWIIVGLSVVILIVGLLTTSEWADGTAARTAARFREAPRRRAQPPSEAVAHQAL